MSVELVLLGSTPKFEKIDNIEQNYHSSIFELFDNYERIKEEKRKENKPFKNRGINEFLNVILLSEGFSDSNFNQFYIACNEIVSKFKKYISPFCEFEHYLNFFTLPASQVLSTWDNIKEPSSRFGIKADDNSIIDWDSGQIDLYLNNTEFKLPLPTLDIFDFNGSDVWTNNTSKSFRLGIIITPKKDVRGAALAKGYGIVTNPLKEVTTRSQRVLTYNDKLINDLNDKSDYVNVHSHLEEKKTLLDGIALPSFYVAHELGHVLSLEDEYEDYDKIFTFPSNEPGNSVSENVIKVPMDTIEEFGRNVIRVKNNLFDVPIKITSISSADLSSDEWESLLTNDEKSELKYFPNIHNFFFHIQYDDQSKGYLIYPNDEELMSEIINSLITSKISKYNLRGIGSIDEINLVEGGLYRSIGVGRSSANCIMRNDSIIKGGEEIEIPSFCRICKHIIKQNILK